MVRPDIRPSVTFCQLGMNHGEDLEVNLISYLVGSSKNMTGGLLTSSRAMASRFLCPPDR